MSPLNRHRIDQTDDGRAPSKMAAMNGLTFDSEIQYGLGCIRVRRGGVRIRY